MAEGIVLPPAASVVPVAPTPAPKKGFWGTFGVVMANVGRYSLLAASWASQHPAVVNAIEQAAKVSGPTGAAIGVGLQVAAGVSQIVEEKQAK